MMLTKIRKQETKKFIFLFFTAFCLNSASLYAGGDFDFGSEFKETTTKSASKKKAATSKKAGKGQKNGKEKEVVSLIKEMPKWAGNKGVFFKKLPIGVYPHKKYLFYLVGDAGEGMDAKGFNKIISKFIKMEYVVICDPVKNDEYTKSYINGIVAEIRRLLRSKIPPRNIIIVGYSYGGMAALRISTRIDNPEVNYVIISGCPSVDGDVYFPRGVDIDPVGMIWNIYGKKDKKFGSLITYLKFNKKKIRAFCQERKIKDKGHNIGTKPHKSWIIPLVRLSKQQ